MSNRRRKSFAYQCLALLLTAAVLSTLALALPKKAPYAAEKEFKKIIRKNHLVFEECGKAEVARTKKKVKGIVLVRFIVNGDGKVIESGPVHNTTKSRFIADCLLKHIDQLQFPATFGPPVTGSYPFKFNLKNTSKR